MNNNFEQKIFRKIRAIEIKTRKLVESNIGGKYTSAFRGLGIEFHNVREYQIGDDISAVDWNVTARTANRKLYVKEFVEERELQVFMVVDTSASMIYSSVKTAPIDDIEQSAPLKVEIAAELAAVLALSAIRNNDKVGLITFSGAVQEYIPPRKGKRHALHIVRDILAKTQAKGTTKLSTILENLYRIINTKAVIFIISDLLLGDDDDYQKPLSILSRKHDCVVMKITDPFEPEFPKLGLINMVDPETGLEKLVDTSSSVFRNKYKKVYQERETYHRKILSKAGVDILNISTAEDYIPVLINFFRNRAKRTR
jgi:uncharacterized protein (DUF58 family)